MAAMTETDAAADGLGSPGRSPWPPPDAAAPPSWPAGPTAWPGGRHWSPSPASQPTCSSSRPACRGPGWSGWRPPRWSPGDCGSAPQSSCRPGSVAPPASGAPARLLARLVRDGFVVFHDLAVPGSPANARPRGDRPQPPRRGPPAYLCCGAPLRPPRIGCTPTPDGAAPGLADHPHGLASARGIASRVGGHCGKGAARGSGEAPRLHHPHKNGRGQLALRRTARAETNDQQQLANAASDHLQAVALTIHQLTDGPGRCGGVRRCRPAWSANRARVAGSDRLLDQDRHGGHGAAGHRPTGPCQDRAPPGRGQLAVGDHP